MRSRDAEVREMLDEAVVDEETLLRNLADIRRINALLGWTRYAAHEVVRRVAAAGKPSFSLLDIAAGSADIPLAIARMASRRGLDVQIVATDINPQIVAVARERAAMTPRIRVERQNALALPYAAGEFDLGLCTLALHHFDPQAAVTLLRNLGRVSRRTLVFDVVRARAAYVGAVLLTRFTLMDRMTQHDAPVSVQRAYAPAEVAALARQAGLRDVRVWVGFPFRLALDARGDA
jgi:2-polyprenyl-3-methyl-5-hydroxy-6-metoxy-1,4-benzoquinol methylase